MLKRYLKTFIVPVLTLALVLTSFSIDIHVARAKEKAELVDIKLTGKQNSPELTNKGGERKFALKGSNIKVGMIKAKVTCDGQATNVGNDLEFVMPNLNKNDDLKGGVKLTFPANTTAQDKVYLVSFSVDGGKTYYDKEVNQTEKGNVSPIKITVKAASGSIAPTPGTGGSTSTTEPEVTDVTTTYLYEMLSVTVKGKNLKDVKLKAVVTGTNINKEWTVISDTTTYTTFALAQSEDSAKTYEVIIYANDKEVKKVSVTVPKKAKSTTVLNVSKENITLPKPGEVEFNITTKDETTNNKIKAKITKDGEVQNINYIITGNDKIFKFSANFPEGNYKITFNADASNSFQTTPEVSVNVASEKTGRMTIKRIMASQPGLPREGGKSNISIIGENIENSIVPTITKNGQVVNNLTIGSIFVDSSGRAASFEITFPRATSGTKEVYTITIADKATTVTVGGRITGDLLDIKPSKVYTNKEKNIITVYFDEPMELTETLDKLKSGITLNPIISGIKTEQKLLTDDTVEKTERGFIIKLATQFKGEFNSTISVGERLLKNKKNQEARAFTNLIRIGEPIVKDSLFTKGEVLTKDGGEVAIKLVGENLKNDGTLVKVIENSKKKNELYGITQSGTTKQMSSKISLTTNTDGTEQIISFNVPENNTNTTKTYMILVSFDGGTTFNSAIGVNTLENRAKKLVASVLPIAKNDGKPRLSFMSITSYGTQGGNTAEEVDITHTVLPINQESKKTWTYVYGANLDKNLTKIRIIDRNGVIWYPLQNEGTSDSTSNFIMVGVDGTGIYGNGNIQMLEVIGMNNLKETETFTYQLSVDGVHYDTDTVVTIEIPCHGPKNTKVSMEPEVVRSVKVTHVTNDGKAIEPEQTIKGYPWAKLRSFGIKNKEYPEYKALGYRKDGNSEITPISGLYAEEIKNLKSVEFVYKKKNENSGESIIENSNSGNSSTNSSTVPSGSNSSLGNDGISGGSTGSVTTPKKNKDTTKKETPAKDDKKPNKNKTENKVKDKVEVLEGETDEKNQEESKNKKKKLVNKVTVKAKAKIKGKKAKISVNIKDVVRQVNKLDSGIVKIKINTKKAKKLYVNLNGKVLESLISPEVKSVNVANKIAEVKLSRTVIKKLYKKTGGVTLKILKGKKNSFVVKLTDSNGKKIKIKGKITVTVKAKRGQKAYYENKKRNLIKLKSKYKKGKLTIKLQVNTKFILR